MTQQHILYVCITCDKDPALADTPKARTGKAMLSSLKTWLTQQSLGDEIIIKAVRCMGGCTTPCSVGLNAKGKQAALFVGLSPEYPEEILPALQQYVSSRIGRIKMHLLPESLKTKYLCRIPQP